MVVVQFLGYSYNLRLSFEKPDSAVLGPQEHSEVLSLISVMIAAHQNYLLFLRRVFVRTWKRESSNVHANHYHL